MFLIRIFKKIRNIVGILAFDTWRYETALRSDSGIRKWLDLRNRNETLSREMNGPGVQCDWRWSSQLHAPKYFPSWGLRLMQRALERDPVNIRQPEIKTADETQPEVSFVIGHRGLERFPLLQLTLNSIANQVDVGWECIVIEESHEKVIEDRVPSWVRYRHLRTDSPKQPYNRSRTFNEGARLAKGRLLIFHDNDMLVPVNYASEMLKKLEAGYQVVNLKRFIFYLNRSHTETIIQSGSLTCEPPEFTLQNLTGGGSLAVEKSAYLRIGGFDEGFVGWGGEDVEFWDRAQTLSVYNYGYLPLVHLWHAPQPEKNSSKDSRAMKRLSKVLGIGAKARIETLSEVNGLH